MSIYSPPYALVQVSVNGAGPVQGGTLGAGQVIPASATIALTGVNTSGWNTALWEIYDYPPGWTAPSGWSTAATGVVYYNGTSVSPNPPAWTAPSVAGWGKWGIRLTVNNNTDPTGAINYPRMQDTSMALSMYSAHGLRDGLAGEQGQFATILPNGQWTQDYKANVRTFEAEIAAVGSPSQNTVALTNAIVNDNVAVPAGTSSLQFNGYTTSAILGGMAISPAPVPGVPFDVRFVGTAGAPVTIVNASAGSSAGNQILTGTDADMLLPVGGQPSARFVRTLVSGTSYYVLQHTGAQAFTTFNVRQFGAQGDGVTDDTAAIQAAINACASEQYELVFPPGIYLVSSELQIPAQYTSPTVSYGFKMRGSGGFMPANVWQRTTIRSTASMRSPLAVLRPATKIEGIKFDGNSLATYACYASIAYFSVFEDCTFANANVDGLFLLSSDTLVLMNCCAVDNGILYASSSAVAGQYSSTTQDKAGQVVTLTGTFTTDSTNAYELVLSGSGIPDLTTLGIRRGDILRLAGGTGANADATTLFFQIGEVVNATTIYLAGTRLPTTSTAFPQWAIGIGDGVHDVGPGGNNSQLTTIGGNFEFNAGSGIVVATQGAFSNRVATSSTQFNCGAGIAMGWAPTITYDPVGYEASGFLVQCNYFEGNIGPCILAGYCSGWIADQCTFGNSSPGGVILNDNLYSAGKTTGTGFPGSGGSLNTEEVFGAYTSNIPTTALASHCQGADSLGFLESFQALGVATQAINGNYSSVFLENTSGGSLTLTSTPSITSPVGAGRSSWLWVVNLYATFPVVLQDQATLAGSGLHLNAPQISIGIGQGCLFYYEGSDAVWVQMSPVSGAGAAGPASATVSLSSGTVTLSAAQASANVLVLTGTLTAAATIVFPNLPGAYDLDVGGLVGLSMTNTLTLQSGSASFTVVTSTNTLWRVVTRGGNTIALNT